MSAEKLAVYAGVSRATINRIETSKCVPSYITAVGIGRVLEMEPASIDELLPSVQKLENMGVSI